jgi:hypothetical protein
MRKNLPAIGQSYTHDDLPLSAQATRNWYPEVNIETTVTVSLQPYPGAEMFSAGTAGADRGVTFWNGNLYKVTGQKLYKINQAGAQTEIGPILGVNRCTFPASLHFLVIVTSGYAYQYEAATLLLTRITDVDLEPPNYGAYLNNQWIYQGTGSRFAVSDAGVPSSVNGLNYATAESDGDPLVRPYVYLQTLYLFGTASIESWYNSGVGTPPFDRIESGIIPTGLGAADSLAHNDNYIYFIGDDRLVYQMQGYQVRPISTIPIAQAFESYASISDAVGFCFTWKGQYFYQLSVGGVTWCFNETAGGWFELTVGTDETPHPATAYVYAYGKALIADGGNLLEMGGELYNGQPVIRERITGLISGELLGEEMIGRPLFMSRCEIIIKGTPPIGVTPQIMLSWSDDAGYTYSNERIIECGSLGNYTFKAVADQLGRFYDRVFKIRISDENSYSLHRMSGDIDGGY